MPKRTDIKSILIIGAGPIVIGQACEFDYSGTQACKALRQEGFRVILVNSNPATIMTDPELADATYIEPITPEVVAKIIAKERPDALLPTMGGQTALNTALSLRRMGVLERYGVEMIGADAHAIDKAEDRALFREAMKKIGLETPKSMLANATDVKDADRKKHEAERAALKAQNPENLDAALDALETGWNLGEGNRKQRYIAHAMALAAQALDEIGLPAIIRPSFTLGGTGGGIAYNRAEFYEIVQSGLDAKDLGAFIMPNEKADLPKSVIFEAGPLLIASASAQKEDALTLADHWMSSKAQQAWVDAQDFPPINKDVKAKSPLIADLVKEINDGGYTSINRFWEATPPQIAEAAVDELGNFMLHPETAPQVQQNLQALADKYWATQK